MEADANEGSGEPHQPIVQMIRAVDVAASFEDALAGETTSSRSARSTWVAFKLASSIVILLRNELTFHIRAPSYGTGPRLSIYPPIFLPCTGAILRYSRVVHA